MIKKILFKEICLSNNVWLTLLLAAAILGGASIYRIQQIRAQTVSPLEPLYQCICCNATTRDERRILIHHLRLQESECNVSNDTVMGTCLPNGVASAIYFPSGINNFPAGTQGLGVVDVDVLAGTCLVECIASRNFCSSQKIGATSNASEAQARENCRAALPSPGPNETFQSTCFYYDGAIGPYRPLTTSCTPANR